MNSIDLIFPYGEEKISFNNISFINDLDLNNMFKRFQKRKFNIDDLLLLFTSNKETIKYRNEIFKELCDNRQLFNKLISIEDSIFNFLEVNRVIDSNSNMEKDLYSIKELELYTDCVDGLYDILNCEVIKSKGLNQLKDIITEIFEGKEYTTLKKELSKQTKKISQIKSITVGINLDAQLKPFESGIVSINTENFKSGNIVDRLLRGEVQRNDYVCMTPLDAVSKSTSPTDQEAINMSIIRGLYNITRRSVSSFRPSVKKYINDKSYFFVNILKGLEFYLTFTSYLLYLKDNGLPLCEATWSENETFCEVYGLYNPKLANTLTGNEIVKNDISFDEKGQIYILTGANQGGKSVFLYSVAFMYVHLILGILLPAEKATLSMIDGIYVYTSSMGNDYSKRSRFEDECKKLGEYSKILTSNSIFLYDEPLSGTSSIEAEEILIGLLKNYSRKQFKGILSTHIHSLAKNVLDINKLSDSKSKIDNLSTVTESSSENIRTFKIIRKIPDYKSFAMDIAKKYGLEF